MRVIEKPSRSLGSLQNSLLNAAIYNSRELRPPASPDRKLCIAQAKHIGANRHLARPGDAFAGIAYSGATIFDITDVK